MLKVIYFAGGCFWGLQHLFQQLNGVVDAVAGYANGDDDPEVNYKVVCTGNTGFKEAVKITYNPKKVSLEFLLMAFFYVINPEQKNRQGNDIGSQYQTGIYYVDDESYEIIKKLYEIEKNLHPVFYVELEPLHNFVKAEAYHQDYLVKNPDGYCHIPFSKINDILNLRIDPYRYKLKESINLHDKINDLSYHVTQEKGTEKPFDNLYYNEFRKGIYVDIVTGEPLFSSNDKYLSSCGWPAFTKPIDKPNVVFSLDLSHDLVRTEVKSRVGNSHLGHVFSSDCESPNGTRYCINSASLRFIPYERMKKEGYSYLLDIFKK